MNLLAETGATDMVSLGALGTFLAGLGALAMTFLKRESIKDLGRKEVQDNQVTLKDPVPVVPVQKVSSPPTYSQHQDLVRRVACIEHDAKEHREHMEGQLRQIRSEQAEQFVRMMQAGETRKDAIMESMNQMVRAFHSRVDQLIDGHRQPPLKHD